MHIFKKILNLLQSYCRFLDSCIWCTGCPQFELPEADVMSRYVSGVNLEEDRRRLTIHNSVLITANQFSQCTNALGRTHQQSRRRLIENKVNIKEHLSNLRLTYQRHDK
jgi:hypothetical protein